MGGSTLRNLPFPLISTALHAVVLVSVLERLDFAVTPPGQTGAVSIRLVAAGSSNSSPTSDYREFKSSQSDRHSEPRAQTLEPAAAAAEPAPRRPEERARPAPAQSNPTTPEAVPPQASAEHQPERSQKPQSTLGSDAQTRLKSQEREKGDSPENRRQANAGLPQTRASSKPGAPAQPSAAQERVQESDRRRAGKNGSADRNQLARQVHSTVVARFQEHFLYPPIARQRGWEGRVVLGFRIDSGGRITHIEVLESSGRALLGNAAVQALEQVAAVAPLSSRPRGRPIFLRLPVTYELLSAATGNPEQVFV